MSLTVSHKSLCRVTSSFDTYEVVLLCFFGQNSVKLAQKDYLKPSELKVLRQIYSSIFKFFSVKFWRYSKWGVLFVLRRSLSQKMAESIILVDEFWWIKNNLNFRR